MSLCLRSIYSLLISDPLNRGRSFSVRGARALRERTEYSPHRVDCEALNRYLKDSLRQSRELTADDSDPFHHLHNLEARIFLDFEEPNTYFTENT